MSIESETTDATIDAHVEECSHCQEIVATLTTFRSTQAWRELLRGRDPVESATASVPSTAGLPELDGYLVHGEIGRGGMGVVFDATHQQLGRRVAVKMLLGGALSGPDRLARFQTEARAIARLRHPHIVAIHDVGEHNGLPFLSLEYVSGPTLTEFIAGLPQTPETAARIVRSLASAVDVAHRQHIVHRDIKPANVLMDEAADGPAVPRLTDFGLARQLDEESHTRTHDLVGTPGYMAPERLSGGDAGSAPAVDIYALGCVLYELLTGRPPFHGSTAVDVARQVSAGRVPSPRDVVASVPRELETICLHCMAPAPDTRYRTALELADDLGRWTQGFPIHAKRASLFQRGRKWAARHPAITVLLSTVIASVFVLLVMWARFTSESVKNLARTRAALRQYLVSMRDDGRLQAANLVSLRADLIEEALALYDEALANSDDPALLSDKAQAHVTLGQLRSQLGNNEAAENNIRAGIRVVRQILAQQLTPEEQADFRHQLAMTQLNLSSHFLRVSNLRESLAAALDARENLQGVLQLRPDDDQVRWIHSVNLRRIGETQLQLGQSTEARPHLEQALEIARQLPPIYDYRLDRSRTLRAYADALTSHSEQAQAEAVLLEARREMHTLLRESRLSRYRWESIRVERSLAELDGLLGNLPRAIQRQQAAIALQRQHARQFREEPRFVAQLIDMNEELAGLQRSHGQPAEAEQAAARARELATSTAALEETAAADAIQRADVVFQQAYTLAHEGKWKEADKCLSASFEELEGLLQAEPMDAISLREAASVLCEAIAIARAEQGDGAAAAACWAASDGHNPWSELPVLSRARHLLCRAQVSPRLDLLTEAEALMSVVPTNDPRAAALVGHATTTVILDAAAAGALTAETRRQVNALLDRSQTIINEARASQQAFGATIIARALCRMADWTAICDDSGEQADGPSAAALRASAARVLADSAQRTGNTGPLIRSVHDPQLRSIAAQLRKAVKRTRP